MILLYYHNKLRGLEQSLVDLALRPEFARHLIRRLSESFLAIHEAGFQAGRGAIDITQVTDDWGSQHGLMISHGMFTDFYRPWMERAIQLAKSHNIEILHHDDGAMREILPDLLEMGIDVLLRLHC